jgi:O-antigen/teichoic acid export membrane protein
LASAEVIGWHAAARKLVGMLIFPASALVGALYPTLARLAQQDLKEFKVVSSDAISTATLLVVPVALGCFLYPDIGVRIFSRESFGPAEQNLQLLSIFVFLVYFSMVLGTVLTAAGTQRAWAVAQAACLVVSCVLDPLLIPWFQAKTGNGGLGLCIATNASELLMVSAGIYLSPPGLFNAALVRKLLLMLVSGLAMVVVAKLLGRFSPFLAAPIAVLAYAGALVATGALDREKALALKNMFARKLARR